MTTNNQKCYDPEFQLLGTDPLDNSSPTDTIHAFRTAPIVTADALHALGPSVFPQRALYGRILAQRAAGFATRPISPKVYINTNAPFSALVCGVQGSGKSHSTSVLLESCLMSDPSLGTLPAPLTAIVFHFDTAAGGGLVQPCEAAYLAALDTGRGIDAAPPAVTVLVLPTNLQAMRRVYAPLPSVRVEPLHFSPEDISGERLLAMMKVDENAQMPLYMEAIMSILRSMENEFDYTQFRDKLKLQKFNPGQKAMLNLRLSLLDSCLQGGNAQNRVSSHFKQGQLTIVDLSSPFMDGSSACGFFDLMLGLFVEADVNATGKLIVLDEAHKYLSESQGGTSARLTDSLLTVIRQQRHLATRVVISTQEPTVVPSKYLDLCSFVIAHRFSSPKWLKMLAQHVSAAEDSFDELFSKIVSLGTGQAILFAPNGVGMRSGGERAPSPDSSTAIEDLDTPSPAAIGQGYLHVQSRLRITRDGGHSILAVPLEASTTRLGRVPARGAGNIAHTGTDSRHSVDNVDEPATLESIRPRAAPFKFGSTVYNPSAPAFVPVLKAPHSIPQAPSMSSSTLPAGDSSTFSRPTESPWTPYPQPSSFTEPPPISGAATQAVVNYLKWWHRHFKLARLPFSNVRKELNRMFPDQTGAHCEGIIWRAEQQKLVVLTQEGGVLWAQLPSLPPNGSLPRHVTATRGTDDHGQVASTPDLVNSNYEIFPPVVLGEDNTASPVSVGSPAADLSPSPTFQSPTPADADAAAVDIVDLQPLMDCLTTLVMNSNSRTVQFTDILEYVNGLSPRPYRSMPKVIVAVREAERRSLVCTVKTADGRWCVTLTQGPIVSSAAASRSGLQGSTTMLEQRSAPPTVIDVPNVTAPTSARYHQSADGGAAVSRTITCRDPHLLPLMRYIVSVHPRYVRDPTQGLSIDSIKNHFEERHPGLYGGDKGKLKRYKTIVAQAIADGMLISSNGVATKRRNLSRITLVPGAQYLL